MASACSYSYMISRDLDGHQRRTNRNVEDVYPHTTHEFFCADTFPSRPLERSHARVLNFIQVLHTLRHINEQVRTGGIGAETPDLACVSDVP